MSYAYNGVMKLSQLPSQMLHYAMFRKVITFLALTALFLGMAVVPIEVHAPNATIRNFFDGIWWATTTVTTVGYGDRVPVTVPGRIIGIALQIVGGLLYGSLVGTFTVYLNRTRDEFYWQRLFARLDQQDKEIEDLRQHLTYMVKKDTPAEQHGQKHSESTK